MFIAKRYISVVCCVTNFCKWRENSFLKSFVWDAWVIFWELLFDLIVFSFPLYLLLFVARNPHWQLLLSAKEFWAGASFWFNVFLSSYSFCLSSYRLIFLLSTNAAEKVIPVFRMRDLIIFLASEYEMFCSVRTVWIYLSSFHISHDLEYDGFFWRSIQRTGAVQTSFLCAFSLLQEEVSVPQQLFLEWPNFWYFKQRNEFGM